jgi:hypothetical protein
LFTSVCVQANVWFFVFHCLRFKCMCATGGPAISESVFFRGLASTSGLPRIGFRISYLVASAAVRPVLGGPLRQCGRGGLKASGGRGGGVVRWVRPPSDVPQSTDTPSGCVHARAIVARCSRSDVVKPPWPHTQIGFPCSVRPVSVVEGMRCALPVPIPAYLVSCTIFGISAVSPRCVHEVVPISLLGGFCCR